MDSTYQQCGLHSTSSSRQHELHSVTYLCALCRSPTANRTPWCFRISNQCTTILMPDGIHITNMNLDDEKSAPPWWHCVSQKAKQDLHVNLAGTRTMYLSMLQEQCPISIRKYYDFTGSCTGVSGYSVLQLSFGGLCSLPWRMRALFQCD